MRKGIDIKTIRNKKTYQAPVLEEVTLDRAIILGGMSGKLEPWENSSYESFSTSSTTEQTGQKSAIFPESENPFGGGKPDYQ